MPSDDELRASVREIVLRLLSEQSTNLTSSKSLALGADHGGYELKKALAPFVSQLGWTVTDCGTFSADPVDYPDIAYAVAKLVSDRDATFGVIIDGAGIGSCIVANKVPGVRASMCYDAATARNSRQHNDANVLTLGGRMLQLEKAREIVEVFLQTECTEERHKRRVEKIMMVEKRFLRK